MQGFARATSYIPSQVSFTTTGNIDNLDFSGADLIRMNNASDATIRGLLAGTPGQRVTIVSIGAGNVILAHQNVNSTATNRLVNFCTSANTTLSAGVGTATFEYDGTTQRWRLISHEQGAFINDTTGTYTADGLMTITVESGDIVLWSYYLKGRSLYIRFSLVDFTLGGTASSTFYGTIPGGFTNSLAVHSVYQLKNNAVVQAGHVFSSTSATTIGFRKIDDSNLALGTNNNDALGAIMLSVT